MLLQKKKMYDQKQEQRRARIDREHTIQHLVIVPHHVVVVLERYHHILEDLPIAEEPEAEREVKKDAIVTELLGC